VSQLIVADATTAATLQKRIEFLKSLKEEPRRIWSTRPTALGAFTLFEEAKTKKEPPSGRRRRSVRRGRADGGQARDPERLALPLPIGICHEGLSDYKPWWQTSTSDGRMGRRRRAKDNNTPT